MAAGTFYDREDFRTLAQIISEMKETRRRLYKKKIYESKPYDYEKMWWKIERELSSLIARIQKRSVS